MTVELHWLKQGSEEWLQFRDGYYTGSNAYKLLGSLGVKEYAKARNDSFTGNFWTDRGHLLEDEAIDFYEKIKKVKVERPGFVTNTEYPGCLYSPDGLAPEPLLEVKCFSVKKHLELIEYVPLKIMAQIQYGLTITKKKYAELVAYNPTFAKRHIMGDYGGLMDNPNYNPKLALVIIRVPRNKATIANFDRILKEMNHVAA